MLGATHGVEWVYIDFLDMTDAGDNKPPMSRYVFTIDLVRAAANAGVSLVLTV